MAAVPKPEFGTDGLRGRAGDPPLDPATLRRVGAALGLHLQRSGPERKRVVFAHDGRDSSSWILESMAQGLAATDCSAVDIGLATTPALAFTTAESRFSAGVMISASHNPATDNGVKIFDASGIKLADAAQDEIAALTTSLEPSALRTPRVRPEPELLNAYVEHLANAFGDLDLTGATVLVDAANGGGSELAPQVLRAFGADVVALNCEPDGYNINDECGALHPARAAEAVVASGAVLGLCLDGDGDRSIFLDDRGRVRDGDDVLLTLAPFLHSRGELPSSTVVTTVMSNLGLHKALGELGVAVSVTPVGDRFVTQRMRQSGLSLGAETSGHVVFAGAGRHTGDGLYTALVLLSMPGLLTGGSSSVFREFTRYPQVLRNVRVARKPPLDEVPAIAQALQEVEGQLGSAGRVFLRYSGTESLCRVLVEGPDRDDVEAHASRLAAIVARELGA
jgi:phosphoglucosamine mutase